MKLYLPYAVKPAPILYRTVRPSSNRNDAAIPMSLRYDAMAAAAEAILAIERRCAAGSGELVGTVGQVTVYPGAPNVIPASVNIDVDIRAATDVETVRLPSGAMHDAMELAALTDVGMLFIRCKGGISHYPDEEITVKDAEIGVRVFLNFIESFKPKHR